MASRVGRREEAAPDGGRRTQPLGSSTQTLTLTLRGYRLRQQAPRVLSGLPGIGSVGLPGPPANNFVFLLLDE